MTNPLAQDLGGVVRLFHETSGDTWAARGTRVVSDPEFPVLRGHVADCVEDDDAAFIAACHEFFRTHSAEIAGALRDAGRWRAWRKLGEHEAADIAWLNAGEERDAALDAMQHGGGGGEAAA